jgi:nucleoside triphosphatase
VKTWRVVAVGVIQNDLGEYLLGKKPETRGMFPGQWTLPGGGIEEGERMEDALRREIREEVGIEVTNVQPLFFKDGEHPKRSQDGTVQNIYSINLVFSCRMASQEVVLGDEFVEYQWVKKERLKDLDTNEETRHTLTQIGLIR